MGSARKVLWSVRCCGRRCKSESACDEVEAPSDDEFNKLLPFPLDVGSSLATLLCPLLDPMSCLSSLSSSQCNRSVSISVDIEKSIGIYLYAHSVQKS